MIHSPLQKKWFSTIIAILMTAFLTILSAGILNLFVVENGMNHFLSDGISAYMSAEWALEYTLLKSSNHREGFSDTISDSDEESHLLESSTSPVKKTTISSVLRASDTSYTGTIARGEFEIIPLFYDRGERIQVSAKHPNTTISYIIKTETFIVTPYGDLSWNIIGNDQNGTTYGIAGTGSQMVSFGNTPDSSIQEGFEKILDDTDVWAAGMKGITTFLGSYQNNYLILSNISDNSVEYHISSDNGFSLPVRSIRASSTVGGSKQNIDFSENRSRLFDMLKYSVFNK